jgi:PAS domain S-box-containing protein
MAADLRAGARCEFDTEALGAQSQTRWAPNLGRVTQTTELKAADPDFLYPLMASFAAAMAADCVYIGTLTTDDAGTVKTVVVVTGGQIIENFEYALAGSPCENVVGKTALIRPKGVRREFPNNPVLKLMDVESYVGAPLFDCRGGSLGLLVVLSRQPLLDTQLAKSLLDVYAVRIAAELERKIAEHALYESDQRFRALFESAADAILLMRGDRFVDCNPSALQLFGCTREQLLGQTLFALSQSVEHDFRESRDLGTENIGRAVRGEISLFHWRAHRMDGSVFDAQITLRRVDGSEPPLLLAHVRDVTDTWKGE